MSVSSQSVSYQDIQTLGLAKPEASKASEELDRGAFLKLLMAQMKNQDPLNPVENADFVAQMAQFSTVDGVQQLNQSFSALASSLQSSQALQASSLVGRTVMTATDQGYLNAELGYILGSTDLKQSTQNVSIQVLDASGQTVRSQFLGNYEPGTFDFAWDGLTDAGTQAPSGFYTLQLRGTQGNEVIQLGTSIANPVDGVTLAQDGSEPKVRIRGLGDLLLSDIQRIVS